MIALLVVVSIVLQIAFGVHAWNRRASAFWLASIVFVPVGGWLAYAVIEWLPGTRLRGALESAADDDGEAVDLDALRAAVEDFDSRANREALARGYSAVGEYGKAIEEFERCLSGTRAELPLLRMEAAFAELKAGRHEDAARRLEALAESNPNSDPERRKLLYAQALEQLGRLDEAAGILAALLPEFVGEEICCRLALMERKRGNSKEALRLLKRMLGRCAKASPVYQREQRMWIELAGEAYKEMTGGT